MRYKYHTLQYKLPSPLSAHNDCELFLVICELIDKLSGSLGGNHDGIVCVISNILNKMIVGVNKGSKAMCN